MLLIEVSDASRCLTPTGVHRVSRGLYLELERKGEGTPVCFDRFQGRWRLLKEGERDFLHAPANGQFDGRRYEGRVNRYRWNIADIVLGIWSRAIPPLAFATRLPAQPFDGLLAPEIIENRRPDEVSMIRRHLRGAAVAVFHDLIPVQFPELSRRRSVIDFPAYLETLLNYDGIAAVSESSKRDLLAYWKEQGVKELPPVETIPPAGGLKSSTGAAPISKTTKRPMILMVGTVEKRKNHLAVIEAAERLWREGLDFELTFAGRLRDGNRNVIDKIDELRSKGRAIRWLGYIPDAQLALQYQTCRFTVYPSLYEGFGLPVLESLGHGRPCIVSNRGALEETAGNGGCHVIEDTTADALAKGMRDLLQNEDLYRRLARECRERELKDWGRYCEELTAWQRTLPKRTVS